MARKLEVLVIVVLCFVVPPLGLFLAACWTIAKIENMQTSE